LIGYDLTDFNIQHLRKGHIDFLLSQQPVQQGHNAVMALYNWIVLGQKQDIEQTPIDIITRENLPFYKNFR
jgi:LacI family transcriptional regulator